MNGRSMLIVATVALALAILSGVAISAQDKYTLRVPDGLAFSAFKGYEDWQLISSAKTDDRMKVILGNPTMIAAYKSGIPGNGKPFPDGSKIAKIEWKPKKSTEAPFSVRIPDVLQDVFLIEKDSKKYPNTKGWAYAVFDYDRPNDSFVPNKTGTIDCGFACHTRVANKDYIFTAYGKR